MKVYSTVAVSLRADEEGRIALVVVPGFLVMDSSGQDAEDRATAEASAVQMAEQVRPLKPGFIPWKVEVTEMPRYLFDSKALSSYLARMAKIFPNGGPPPEPTAEPAAEPTLREIDAVDMEIPRDPVMSYQKLDQVQDQRLKTIQYLIGVLIEPTAARKTWAAEQALTGLGIRLERLRAKLQERGYDWTPGEPPG